MAEITVNIETPDEMIITECVIPSDYRPEQIIAEVIDELNLPRLSPTGQPIDYHLILADKNINLPFGQTLHELRVQDGDTIRLVALRRQSGDTIGPSKGQIVREGASAISGLLSRTKVFLVHGRDMQVRTQIERFLRDMELETIILANQPNQGMSIIEKFENYATNVSYAVILMTPDDAGGLRESNELSLGQERARQNVIFELGFFVGRLGRGRICLLRKGNVEIPSDLHGVVYIDIDDRNNWSWGLADELIAAGIIKMNHAYGACRRLLSGS